MISVAEAIQIVTDRFNDDPATMESYRELTLEVTVLKIAMSFADMGLTPNSLTLRVLCFGILVGIESERSGLSGSLDSTGLGRPT